uniref:Secreted protein n=1 Tax=Rhizophora mucronata TaxID=61149 RepID=A0A2P2MW46_RHIMU
MMIPMRLLYAFYSFFSVWSSDLGCHLCVLECYCYLIDGKIAMTTSKIQAQQTGLQALSVVYSFGGKSVCRQSR